MREVGWDVPRVAVDAIVELDRKLVLVRRGKAPFKGMYALPGGFVEFGERLEDAVEREVLEETGLQCEVERLLGVYGNPGRDPRGHTISIAYVLRSFGGNLRAGSDAAGTALVATTKVPRLSFDHNVIVSEYRKDIQLRRRSAAIERTRAQQGKPSGPR